MPHSPQSSSGTPRRPLRLAAGVVIGAAVALLIVLVLWSITATAATDPGTSPSRIDLPWLVLTTTIQAGLTTVLSLLVGTALAWALNRLRFPGRELIVGLFASAIVTPGIIIAFGLLAVWGRAGWVAELTGVRIPIFGLGGILFAHVILDASFAARILLARLESVPDFRLKTGQSLGLSAIQRFALIDVKKAAPSVAPGTEITDAALRDGEIDNHGARTHRFRLCFRHQHRRRSTRNERRGDDDVLLGQVLCDQRSLLGLILSTHRFGIARSGFCLFELFIFDSDEFGAERSHLLFRRRPHVGCGDDSAKTARSGDGLQAGDTDAHHEHPRGGNSAGGGHHHRKRTAI